MISPVRSLVACAGGVLALAVAARAVTAQQLPPRTDGGASVVVGQVVDGDSGRGVPGAVVQIGPLARTMGASGNWEENLSAYGFGMRFVVADGDGHFAISGVGAGSFGFVVRMSGYILSAYGQSRPGAPSREIAVDGKNPVNDVVIKAWKQGVISGTVFDEDGEPAVGVAVRALKRAFVAGRAVFSTTFATERTNDLGQFRLFNLDPGDYIVVVPSTTVTVPTPAVASYREAVASGNSAVSTAIQRDASGMAATLTSPITASVQGYSVLAGSRARGLILPGATALSVYQTTFHPDTSQSREATVISLRSGEERSSADIRLHVVKSHRVSGQVTAPPGISVRVQVSLIPATHAALVDAPGFETATALAGEDGRFQFLGVPEGQYLLRVLKIQRDPTPAPVSTTIDTGGQTTTVMRVEAAAPGAANAGTTVWAQVPVSVTQDLAGIAVPVVAGARFTGRAEFKGNSPLPPSPVGLGTVTVVSAEGRSFTELSAARIGTDLRFRTAQYPPGDYYLAGATFGGRWSVTSIRVNGRDAMRTPVALGADDVADVLVTFTDDPAEVSGTVRDRTAGVADATVVLFPAQARSWIAAGMTPRLLRVASTVDGGAFRMTDVLPGEYLAVAYPSATPRTWQDPAFITELAQAATPVSVAAAEKKSLTLTLVVVR